MSDGTKTHKALQSFAENVTTIMPQLTTGEPKDKLRWPFEVFMSKVALVRRIARKVMRVHGYAE